MHFKPAGLAQRKFFPNIYDFSAFIIIMAAIALAALGAEGMNQTLVKLQASPIELSVVNLPKYALYTTLRMFAAIIASLIFTFVFATLAAKSRRAEMIIIPALDILQSVPVLGFLTFTVPFCMGLFPGYQAGVEAAAIFAVFTSQAWNMAFSFYQSLRTVPQNLKEVSAQFCLNSRQKFWRLEVPYAIPGLVWNTMMSMSGGWFFVVASEAISIGNTQISLPGIGSWLGLAINNQDFGAVAWAVLAMAVVILIYDQLIFRPIVAWSDKFSLGLTAGQQQPKSWVYDMVRRSNTLAIIVRPFAAVSYILLDLKIPFTNHARVNYKSVQNQKYNKILDFSWAMLILVSVLLSIVFLSQYLSKVLTLQTMIDVFILGLYTLLRIFILIIICSLIWVPIGVWVGLRPKMVAYVQPIAQFLAAFPANILFPVFVIIILKYNLDPDIWLSPLMILGTQWYIFFNVIAGASAFPNDLKEAADIYKVQSWLWWRKIILPGILPYYVTGALTATGGSWNASIVAEVVHWGSDKLEARGLGGFITIATAVGDFHRVVLGVAVMSIFVMFFNRVFWRRLYSYTAKNTGTNQKDY